jgi:hypothetical protein
MEDSAVGVEPRPERTSQRAGEHHPRMSQEAVCQRSGPLPDTITTTGAGDTSRVEPTERHSRAQRSQAGLGAGQSLRRGTREWTSDRTPSHDALGLRPIGTSAGWSR